MGTDSTGPRGRDSIEVRELAVGGAKADVSEAVKAWRALEHYERSCALGALQGEQDNYPDEHGYNEAAAVLREAGEEDK